MSYMEKTLGQAQNFLEAKYISSVFGNLLDPWKNLGSTAQTRDVKASLPDLLPQKPNLRDDNDYILQFRLSYNGRVRFPL